MRASQLQKLMMSRAASADPPTKAAHRPSKARWSATEWHKSPCHVLQTAFCGSMRSWTAASHGSV